MSSLGRHTDWVGTLIRYNSKIRYKPVKKLKSVISVITTKPLDPDFAKSTFNRLGVFRSDRDLEVHKRMRSSDATCCASMAVNTCFFSTCEMPPSNMASRSPKTWCKTHFHALIRMPPSLDSFIVRYNTKIRYKSVIKSVINPL